MLLLFYDIGNFPVSMMCSIANYNQTIKSLFIRLNIELKFLRFDHVFIHSEWSTLQNLLA